MNSSEAEVEKIYQKKTQLEHILLRPDTYVGSIEKTDANLWVLEENATKFQFKSIEYVPGLYKIFDEILVNAADNYQRDGKMNTIKVNIDEDRGFISIWNNGKGIPVQIHKQYDIYVPELIFGHLLTSSNYDDTQKKVTGGRNGYGAKLTNIFSKKFVVDTADSKKSKRFKMVWKQNMSSNSTPQIEPFEGTDYTCISFEPDLKRFGMAHLDKDTVALMRKRVYDLAGVISNSIKVYFNGKKIPIAGFNQYTDMYLDDNVPKIREQTRRWEVIASISEGQFQQVSFVNSICTSRGGTHVQYLVDQITDQIADNIKKKHKDLNIKPFQIRNYLSIFVNCQIENPAFDSQTKETLTLKPSNFGSKCHLTDKFLKDFQKCGIIDAIVSSARAKSDAKLAKALTATKKSRLLGIPKLEDANDAGTRYADQCTLILTEGDSAKSLAMSGIEMVGRDRFGVFPLKGKLLNVRDANNKQIMDNSEVQHIIKILGLQVGKKYQDVKSLRYGSVMIMADQDHDGSHIKGLLINFIHHFWPSLAKMDGFVKQFITPILKATKGQQVKTFFTIQDFKRWASDPYLRIKQWKIKYYKGLGTNTDKEAKEYFRAIDRHQIDFEYVDQIDDQAIELAFSKKKIEARKQWLSDYDPDLAIDHNVSSIRYRDFINRELIHFSNSDNMRSIPSLCDGFKPGQRKIMYSCFKRNLKDEIKVGQLAGYVSEHSAYHHGEASLQQTIVGLAQNFVGSNNVNLLLPIGQFGSRAAGGKDSASARYIFTGMSKVTKALFSEHDEHLYKYLEDDGQPVEPEWYLPAIPLILVNGAEGIGTGWSTSVPSFNPHEIIENIKNRLIGDEFRDMKPWFKGYSGEIDSIGKGGYVIKGKFQIDPEDEDTIEITELPIKKWTKDYKHFLETTMLMPENGEPEIEDIKEHHTNDRIHFIIKMKEGILQRLTSDAIEKKFKLSTTIQTSNMVLFNTERRLKKYANVSEIMEEFFSVRLKYYGKRKEYLVSKIQREIEILQNKKRFILAVISNDVNIRNIRKKEIVKLLLNKGYTPMNQMCKLKTTKQEKLTKETPKLKDQQEDNEDDDDEDTDMESVPASEFNYLLSMPLWSLTYEKVESLKRDLEDKQRDLQVLEDTTIEQMWVRDLDELTEVINETWEIEEQDRLKGGSMKRGAKSMIKRKKTGGGRKKKGGGGASSDGESSGDEWVSNSQKKKRSNSQSMDIEKKPKKKGGRANSSQMSTGKSSSKSDEDDFFPEFRNPKPIKKKNDVSKQETSSTIRKSKTIGETERNNSSSQNSSILKYLKFTGSLDMDKSNQNSNGSGGYSSLSQRLQQREKTGEFDAYFNSYSSQIKKGPTEQEMRVFERPSTSSKKRKKGGSDEDKEIEFKTKKTKRSQIRGDSDYEASLADYESDAYMSGMKKEKEVETNKENLDSGGKNTGAKKYAYDFSSKVTGNSNNATTNKEGEGIVSTTKRASRTKSKRKVMLDLSSGSESGDQNDGSETEESDYDVNFDLSKYFNR